MSKLTRLRLDARATHTKDNLEPPAANDPPRASVERRAYEIYLSRGGADGLDLEDWLQAERELCHEPGGSDCQSAAR